MKLYLNTIKYIKYNNIIIYVSSIKLKKLTKRLTLNHIFIRDIKVKIKEYWKILMDKLKDFFKRTNFNIIEKKKITYVENWINNRPMKILKYIPFEQPF